MTVLDREGCISLGEGFRWRRRFGRSKERSGFDSYVSMREGSVAR
jgi:hypothetical protein